MKARQAPTRAAPGQFKRLGYQKEVPPIIKVGGTQSALATHVGEPSYFLPAQNEAAIAASHRAKRSKHTGLFATALGAAGHGGVTTRF
jgi:predicted benzoate:H+ symporter BenE